LSHDTIKGVQKKHEKKRDLRNYKTLSWISKEKDPGGMEKRMLALGFNPPLTDKIIKMAKEK
jgi:hypothetical protein